MKIIIIGAVAAGTSAAAKARRNNEEATIVIYERDSFISYSSCGMPYFIGGEIDNDDELIPRNSDFFKSKYNVDVKTLHDVLSIDPESKTVFVKNLETGEMFNDTYDKMVIATGASPVVPNIQGVDNSNVFTLRNISDMHRIKTFIDEKNPKTAAIIGSGFIGLELCENLKKLGIEINLIEHFSQVSPSLDNDMAIYVEDYIKNRGVNIFFKSTVDKIGDNLVSLTDGKEIEADIVLISTGVRPNTELAKAAGVELGNFGAIKVNHRMQTNVENIYACGDCIEHYHLVTKKYTYRPLGSTANKTGIIVGDIITGGNLEFRGIIGTGIFRIFDMTVAQTGLSEREAIENGYNVVVCHNIKPNKPSYMGGKEMVIKGIADKSDGRLLGAQIVGFEGVDKRIDVFATAITFNAKVEDLFHLDLAYAPPFSTTKDPVMYTGMILNNAILNERPLITSNELDVLINSGEKYNLIDTRATSQYEIEHIETAQSIPQSKLREKANELDKNSTIITYCNKGVTGNATQNILLNYGFKKVYNLSGGHKHYRKIKNKSKI